MTVSRRAAVLGKPIAHSLSPVIHTAGYAAAGLFDWTYEAIECAEAELPGLVAGFGPEWAGLSLTMPLKEEALRLAATATKVARATGAANTLVRREHGTWHADNTDVAGMVRVADDRGDAVAFPGEQGGQVEGHFAVAADNSDAGHAPILPPNTLGRCQARVR